MVKLCCSISSCSNKMRGQVSLVIPAHLDSKRLSQKVILDIKGKPMLLRVLEQCVKAISRNKIWVATPDKKIERLVEDWGYQSLCSGKGLPDGTSAIASVMDQLKTDYVANIQSDQPLIPPDLVCSLVSNLVKSKADVVTPVYRIDSDSDLVDPGIAKVVRDLEGGAMYFSRSPIPYVRDQQTKKSVKTTPFWGHYGIYGYKQEVLLRLRKLKDSYLERAEKLEQLRFLQNGLRIFTFETKYRQMAVDTVEDLKRVQECIN